MTLHDLLRSVGIVALAWWLLVWIGATGPIGWLFFGTLLTIGVVQVHRTRRQRGAGDGTVYCANCGSAMDLEAFEPDDATWSVEHCSNCGTPVDASLESAARDDEVIETRNCPACGAPNETDRATCTHCETAL